MSSKKDNKKTKYTPKQKRWIKKRLIIIFATIAIVALLIDITPFGGNLRLYAKWIECGRKPVERVGIWAGGSGHDTYEDPAMFPIRLGLPTYYCTPLEAEEAGLSASKHHRYYPHLEKQNSESKR